MITVKDILKQMREGKTTEQIAEDFSDMLNEAETQREEELNAEKAKQKALEAKHEAMEAVIAAINNYFVTIGEESEVINLDELGEEKKELLDVLCMALDCTKFISKDKKGFNFAPKIDLYDLL